MKILYLQKNNMKMVFSEKTKKIAEKYNIDESDVIFAKMISAEISLKEALFFIYGSKNKNEEISKNLFKKKLEEKPGLKVLILKLKELKKNKTDAAEVDFNELCTREGVVSFLQRNLAMTTGKDAVSGAQALAKILGFDKIDEKKDDEKKIFHLPYKANCRFCDVYRVYCELFESEKNKMYFIL